MLPPPSCFRGSARHAWRVANDRAGRSDLVRRLKRLEGPQVVGFEASDGYERGLLKALLDAKLPARRINPTRIREFAQTCGAMAKNDRCSSGWPSAGLSGSADDVRALDAAIAKAVAKDPDLGRKNTLIRSVPCVGPVLSHTLLGLMPGPCRLQATPPGRRQATQGDHRRHHAKAHPHPQRHAQRRNPVGQRIKDGCSPSIGRRPGG